MKIKKVLFLTMILALFFVGPACTPRLTSVNVAESSSHTEVAAGLGDAIQVFYVSPDGNDSNKGSKEHPFKTIQQAQTAVRSLATGGLKDDVYVYIRQGIYYLNEPLVFSPADSGTATYSITYQNYPGENPIISGGKKITTGWTSIGGDKYTTTIPAVAVGKWWFRQLWSDGQRCQRSRWPNPDPGSYPDNLLDVTAVSGDFMTITFNETIIGSNMAANDTELVVYNDWSIGRAKIASTSGASVTTQTACGCIGHGTTQPAAPHDDVYLEHNPDYIDQATEWHLNRSSGLLTYQAPAGVNPNDCFIVAPKLEKLVVITGTESNPVRNIIFKGLSFKNTSWVLPAVGYGGIQAGHYSQVWETLPVYVVPLTIELSYADSCKFQRCSVANIAQTAIGFGAGCDDNVVEDCHLYDIGGGGVMTGWRGDSDTGSIFSGIGDWDTGGLSADWPDGNDTPLRNIISNNYLHDIAAEWFGCVGISDAFCKDTEIRNNIVADLPYTGISVGFNWGDSITSQEGLLVKQNHVHGVAKILNDGGCLYTLGNHQGGVMSGNLFHDVHVGRGGPGAGPSNYDGTNGWLNNAIFIDNGSTNIYIADTVSYNVFGDYPTDYRFNHDPAGTTFGTNYWDSPPAGWGAAEQAIADAAGTHPAAPVVTLSSSSGIMVRGHSEAWAKLVSAAIAENSQDVTAHITIEENGAIHGIIPRDSVSGISTVTLEIVVSDPDGEHSVSGVSNTFDISGMVSGVNCDNEIELLD